MIQVGNERHALIWRCRIKLLWFGHAFLGARDLLVIYREMWDMWDMWDMCDLTCQMDMEASTLRAPVRQGIRAENLRRRQWATFPRVHTAPVLLLNQSPWVVWVGQARQPLQRACQVCGKIHWRELYRLHLIICIACLQQVEDMHRISHPVASFLASTSSTSSYSSLKGLNLVSMAGAIHSWVDSCLKFQDPVLATSVKQSASHLQCLASLLNGQSTSS